MGPLPSSNRISIETVIGWSSLYWQPAEMPWTSPVKPTLPKPRDCL